jgi:hypothetical protein
MLEQMRDAWDGSEGVSFSTEHTCVSVLAKRSTT